MNEWIVLLITALIQGIGMGSGVAIGTYFVGKTLIRSFERAAEAMKKKNGSNG
jgi:hypothetical protein